VAEPFQILPLPFVSLSGLPLKRFLLWNAGYQVLSPMANKRAAGVMSIFICHGIPSIGLAFLLTFPKRLSMAFVVLAAFRHLRWATLQAEQKRF